MTWFQIPPTTVNLFAYLLTVSWQLTFMFKIKCLIDYFLERWWDVVLYLSQSISGLSHYWSPFLPFLGSWCLCVHVCAPAGWGNWRLEERSLHSRSGGKLGFSIRSPKTACPPWFLSVQGEMVVSRHDSQVKADSQRTFMMVISMYQKSYHTFLALKTSTLLLPTLEISSNISKIYFEDWDSIIFFNGAY